MTRMLLLICLFVAAGALVQLLRHRVREQPQVGSLRRPGWLDDDGVRRGERWDGSPFSAPRTALSLG